MIVFLSYDVFSSQGGVDSRFGPALQDLQCIFNVTPQKVSLSQPIISAGWLITTTAE